ncbi:MAG: TIGR03618 family F420-dependent PPOX class oxidoreductase [Herbiconiux sp.]|nr:TIGR03618 family F420-dependent PPOX class oxidoreductase [Herbiconiux sp.]
MSACEKVRPFFERAAVVHVATLLPDGAPHSVPVWVGVEGEQLAVFMIEGSRKDRNLQGDPRIALSVTRPDEPFDMATVRGTVATRLTGEAAMRVVDRIAVAYTGAAYEQRTGLVAYLIEPTAAWAHDYSSDPAA